MLAPNIIRQTHRVYVARKLSAFDVAYFPVGFRLYFVRKKKDRKKKCVWICILVVGKHTYIVQIRWMQLWVSTAFLHSTATDTNWYGILECKFHFGSIFFFNFSKTAALSVFYILLAVFFHSVDVCLSISLLHHRLRQAPGLGKLCYRWRVAHLGAHCTDKHSWFP